MKWRIVLAVLFVVLLFAGFAYLYVNTFIRRHQHAVILFIVNGLDLNTLNAARQQLGPRPLRGSESDDPGINTARRQATYRNQMLNLDAFWNVALLSIQQPGQPVPDEGANATALACGRRVQNGYVAVNNSNEALQSLIYAAAQARRGTGLVTTSSLVQPTPVAFYSTTRGAPEPYRNANDLLYSGIDIVLGGGEQYFTPATASNEWGRRDGRNLLQEAKDHDYVAVRTREELNKVSTWELSNVSTWQTRRIFGVFAPGSFYFSSLRAGNPRQPSLAEMTRIAISNLNNNIDGYFLVVEHGLVARAAEQNFSRLAVNEVADVDEAIQTAVEYAGPDALVIVTNSYSLGALGPLATPPASDLAGLPLTMDAAGAVVKTPPTPLALPPPPAWATGPGGPPVTKEQALWLRQYYDSGWFSAAPGALVQPQPALRFQTRAQIIAEPAWLASRGDGSTQLRGFLNNTDLFDIISEQF